MLTVKILKSSGDEVVFEATNVVKEKNGMLVYADGGIEFYGPEGHMYAIDADIRTQDRSGHGSAGVPDAMAWVMNRHGATVATYHL